ncbi:hypothetical protein FPK54_28950, partial [Acinetobacter baumannii]|nr:hypothetical protein [Acinetobacter baumannii]
DAMGDIAHARQRIGILGVGLQYLFKLLLRGGGREGDRIVAELIAALPDVLAEGGTAQLLANWEIPAGDTADADTAPWD